MATELAKKKTVEEIYQKKTPLEHVLLRPDTYIGSTSSDYQQMWIWDDITKKIIKKNILYTPGLYKIFDEILVNASDNKRRDPKMTTIRIDIDPVTNKIQIWNDGKGIPVVIHKEEQIYIPSMIFGHLLTSSNFDDTEKKITGGRNGYGAKLCNIFSNKFIVETSCSKSKKKFFQSWDSNMRNSTKPLISEYKGTDFTCVSFIPDLSRFNVTQLDPDFVALLKRRAYDIAGTTPGINVYLNGQHLNISSFKEYACLYSTYESDSSLDPQIIHEKVNDRWEICVLPSDGSFQQISFVNSIATSKGGTHVNHVVNKIITKLIEDASKKIKNKTALKPANVKNHISVFINCLIENPSFDSQTKENMTLVEKDFGSSCNLSPNFLKKISSAVTENIVSWYDLKMKAELAKKGTSVKRSKLHGIPKLDDANDAGTKNSSLCTLILTEGDSAKTLAVAGLGVIGRDRYGVFPLRGKFLNVRDAQHSTIIKNKEVESLIKIIGLDFKNKYSTQESINSLRYGKVMIMSDQDQDGSHIKGLVINFFHHLWPQLIRNDFIEEFITPIVKVSKGDEVISFYSIPEFEEWQRNTPNHNTYKTKYYKGLGTSTSKEGREYFSNINRHQIKFKYSGDKCDESINLAFSKHKIEERKDWLTNYYNENIRRRELGLPEIYLYHTNTKAITYQDFVNKELILFSLSDNTRSIPSLVDGLKPGQRKVLFTCLKRNDKREIKVAQLAGSVAETSAYHHGEVSLMTTIINLAQDFVGSNNLPLLQPIGQFGTRLHGGKDSASPRYIYTMLSKLARYIFPSDDDAILTYLYDDNQMIEPEWYCPIIPMVLVNGSEGIGTGYASKIPNFNPREIVNYLKSLIKCEQPKSIIPWYKNFAGRIIPCSSLKYITTGRLFIIGDDSIEISELPIRCWTQSYKEEVIEPLCKVNNPTGDFIISDYKEYHTDTTVRFIINLLPGTLSRIDDSVLLSKLKLESVINLTNMVLFDSNGVLRKYETVDDIIKDFYNVRIQKYVERKKYLEDKLTAEALKYENQARFILEKIEGILIIENKKRTEMIKILKDRNYISDPVKAWQSKLKIKFNIDEEKEEDNVGNESIDYNYLLGMNFWYLTLEKKEELLKLRDDKKKELDELKKLTPQDIWLIDLDKFLSLLDKMDEGEVESTLKDKTRKLVNRIKTPKRLKEINFDVEFNERRNKTSKSAGVLSADPSGYTNGDKDEKVIRLNFDENGEDKEDVKVIKKTVKRRLLQLDDKEVKKNKRLPVKEKKEKIKKTSNGVSKAPAKPRTKKDGPVKNVKRQTKLKHESSDENMADSDDAPISREPISKRKTAAKKYVFEDSDDDDVLELQDSSSSVIFSE